MFHMLFIFLSRWIVLQNDQYDWGPGMRGWGFGMGWYWPPIIIGILFAAIVIGIVFLLLRKPVSRKEEPALEVLKKRYAKGEISCEEFEEKKRDLES